MAIERPYVLTPRAVGQSFEEWVEQALYELHRTSQEEGALAPVSIDLDNLADGDYLNFDATNQVWTNGNAIPANLEPSDGDKGDITVASGTWTIDSGVVTYAKIQDVTADRLLGRTGTGGSIEELTLGAGLAFSGDSLIVTQTGSKIIKNWGPHEASFPASNYATLDTRNTHPILDFDTTTQETVYFHGVMPDNYANEGITVEVWWTVTTVTSGTVGWDVSLELMDGLDVDSDSFATAQTITATTVSGTNGTLQSSTVNISDGANMDSIDAGDMFRIRIRRDVASDTAADDAELHMVEMRIQ